MTTRTVQQGPMASPSDPSLYNPLKWVQDFEMELLENNRQIFSRIYNTDIEDYWLNNEED
ncbi:hypothetical protein UR09_01770 [Candidatus Nitromaritima sp. SCGC AAA799-A02]|nr:hypothetical protein UR09_01770 [Candidatus Nitromaritima sp. SCGC AAA799-A02]